jgi:hypothetical protein
MLTCEDNEDYEDETVPAYMTVMNPYFEESRERSDVTSALISRAQLFDGYLYPAYVEEDLETDLYKANEEVGLACCVKEDQHPESEVNITEFLPVQTTTNNLQVYTEESISFMIENHEAMVREQEESDSEDDQQSHSY